MEDADAALEGLFFEGSGGPSMSGPSMTVAARPVALREDDQVWGVCGGRG